MPTEPLTKEQCIVLADAGWRSPSEYCRLFLPEWFPTKMPWFHRGLAALRTGKTEFLLDFGEEKWPEDVQNGTVSHWTVRDVVKIVTNFVIVEVPAKFKDGELIEPEVLRPIFVLAYDPEGTITGIHILDPQDNNAFICPRGFSKTTLINAMNLRDVCYKEEKFILYVSETGPHATAQLLTLRSQLENNELLRAVFGDLVPARTDSRKWGENEMEPTNGTRVAAIGSGGQLRGIVKDAVRPSRITIDDFQNEDGCKSPIQRAKDVNWLARTLLPARKLFGEGRTKVDMIGTLLHAEAVMAILMSDPDWTRVRFGAIDRQNEPLWAYAVDLEKLAKIRAQMERLGQLEAFDFEYMSSLPINDGVVFPVDKIVHINRPDEWFVAKAVVCDPAISDNPKADFCTLAVVGIGKFGKIHVVDFHGELGMEFDAQAEKFFEFHFAHCLTLPPDQVKHGIEAVAYQRALISLVSSKQHEKSKTWGQRAFFEVIPILHGKTGKNIRVQGLLSPRVKAGHVSHERMFGVLEGQMRDWGQRDAKKDGPDVIAMGISLLDPYASLNASEEDEDGNAVFAVGAKLPPLKQALGGRSFRHAP